MFHHSPVREIYSMSNKSLLLSVNRLKNNQIQRQKSEALMKGEKKMFTLPHEVLFPSWQNCLKRDREKLFTIHKNSNNSMI